MMLTTATWITSITILLFQQCQETQSKQISVCYYRNWAQYKEGKARFVPEDIDPKLCSVVNYAAMRVNLKTHKLEGRQNNDDDMLRRINNLKSQNPSMKVFLSAGGWTHEEEPRYSRMVSTFKSRTTFIRSVIEYLTTHKLDGINIDWEYPGFRGSPANDTYKFTDLLQEMFLAFQVTSGKRNIKRFYLTLAVSASTEKILNAYQIKKIANYVDWVDVMAYNLRGPWRAATGCATLMKGDDPTVPGAVSLWLQGGMPAGKINLGLASYGRTFTLINSKLHNVGDPATKDGGHPGTYTKKAGIMSYYEICLAKSKWTHTTPGNESSCGIPYASFKKLWVAYDDVASVKRKVSMLVNARGLNGVSFWALDFDDFTGTNCNQGKYPLLSAAVEEMANNSVVNRKDVIVS